MSTQPGGLTRIPAVTLVVATLNAVWPPVLVDAQTADEFVPVTEAMLAAQWIPDQLCGGRSAPVPAARHRILWV